MAEKSMRETSKDREDPQTEQGKYGAQWANEVHKVGAATYIFHGNLFK